MGERLDRFQRAMDQLVRRWLPDLSEEARGAVDREKRRMVLIPVGDLPPGGLVIDVARSIGTLAHADAVLAYIVPMAPTQSAVEAMAAVSETTRRQLLELADCLRAAGVAARSVCVPSRFPDNAVDLLAHELGADLVLHELVRPAVTTWPRPVAEADGSGAVLEPGAALNTVSSTRTDGARLSRTR